MYPRIHWATNGLSFATNQINASTEAVHFVGHLILEGGSDSGSKTISTSGPGNVFWRAGTVIAFADAGTNFRIGLQDPDVTASPVHGDGTFDVYADLVGGTDTVTGNTAYETAMETGTKTLDHGDLICVAFEFTARGGSDSVAISTGNNIWDTDSTGILPGAWFDDGTPAATGGKPIVAIEFDDGSIGWLADGSTVTQVSSEAYHVDTSVADEFGNLIKPEMDILVSGVNFSAIINGDAEICLYSDPLGTPSLLEAVTVDATGIMSSANTASAVFTSEHLLRTGQSYGYTLRPTTTTSNTLYGSGSDASGKYWAGMGLTADAHHAIERINNSGAFTVSGLSGTDKDRRFHMALRVRGIRTRIGNATPVIGI
jgi:hypothetical protein